MEPVEPILADDDIQGNILAGFNKPYQNFISLNFGEDLQQAKSWLSALNVTSLQQVMEFRNRFRAFKRFDLVASLNTPTVIWTNIAFTKHGLSKLSPDAVRFKDAIFNGGLGAASPRLKDPTEEDHPGNQKNWLFGGIGNEADVLVILAADIEEELKTFTNAFLNGAVAQGLSCIHIDFGKDLGTFGENDEEIERLRATEHFGFKDGLSHPGIRGRLASTGGLLTNRESPGPQDPIDIAFSKPGQPLIYPGEFILGNLRQSDSSGQIAVPADPIGEQVNSRAPGWAKNGSFLVYRRLRQDVRAFQEFLSRQSEKLAEQQCPIGPKHLGAALVGRWPNGAPLVAYPEAEPEDYAGDNEGFRFEVDITAKLCPASAHIRKVNPRGLTTEQGGPQKTLIHRMLRRGIPFGKPYTDDPGDERGLIFISYQNSIAEQFEFLQKNWANHYKNPHSLLSNAGQDMVIGQTSMKTDQRNRYLSLNYNDHVYQVSTQEMEVKDWVIPTGGGYYFSPSISAIRDVLCRKQQL